jgi:multiple sugar transport system substrate-binding protein
MKLSGKVLSIVGMTALIIGIVAGCGGKSDNTGQPAPVTNEPVTLVMTSFSTSTNEGEFNDYMKPNIEKKFPNITLKWVQPQAGSQLEDQIAAGQIPDIIATGYASIPKLRDLDIALNLNDLIKKNGFNLGIFEPVALQSVKIYGENGEVFALPYTNNYFAAFYNKDVFDRFAMPYPADNLTWDQMLEITHKIDKLGGGDSYRGMIAGANASLLGRALSLPLVDPKSDTAKLNTDSWLKIAKLFKEIYTTPESFKSNNAKAFLDGKVGVFPN